MTTPALIVSLLAWLGAHSGYALPSSEASLPTAHFRTMHELRVLYYGSEEKARANSSHRDVRAVYDPRVNRLFISAEFDAANPEYKTEMLHELVHFLQAFNGRKYTCLAESEPEAYRLTNKWIAETGAPVPLLDTFYAVVLAAECSFPSTPPN